MKAEFIIEGTVKSIHDDYIIVHVPQENMDKYFNILVSEDKILKLRPRDLVRIEGELHHITFSTSLPTNFSSTISTQHTVLECTKLINITAPKRGDKK